MKKHRKIQKKQETELHVQVAEKPENQKENVGEALACFCIYVGVRIKKIPVSHHLNKSKC